MTAAPLDDHQLIAPFDVPGIRYERRPCPAPDGSALDGLFNAWITLDRPEALNAYTTEMLKGLILAFHRADLERDVVSVVLTGEGARSFCTGGDAKHYASAYAGRPDEFRQYLGLFVDTIQAILLCDKPVVNRVNGMRLAGGNEFGIACDLTIASDLAVFGQAGPKHGSAPIMGSTQMLPLFVGIERAMLSCTLCEPWTAYEALRNGLITEAVPVLVGDDGVEPNPLVITDRYVDGGRIVYGQKKQGDALAEGKARLKAGTVDLAPLDTATNQLLAKLAQTMPGCLTKTVKSLRHHKRALWEQEREDARGWLSLNMMTEAKAGFRAFLEGPKTQRHVNYAELRRRLAQGQAWDADLFDAIMPKPAS